MSKPTLVTFNADIFPYCRGDVVALTNDELKRVDKVAADRNVEEPYTKGANEPTEVPETDAEIAAREELASKVAEAEAAAQAKDEASALEDERLAQEAADKVAAEEQARKDAELADKAAVAERAKQEAADKK